MNLRTRLLRLEQTAEQQRIPILKPPPPSTEQEQCLAYLRGDGPRPPCPPWIDPLKWDSELRVECCLLERLRGAGQERVSAEHERARKPSGRRDGQGERRLGEP
jgi:hypothetical protein